MPRSSAVSSPWALASPVEMPELVASAQRHELLKGQHLVARHDFSPRSRSRFFSHSDWNSGGTASGQQNSA